MTRKGRGPHGLQVYQVRGRKGKPLPVEDQKMTTERLISVDSPWPRPKTSQKCFVSESSLDVK